jgi:hypothetical protein
MRGLIAFIKNISAHTYNLLLAVISLLLFLLMNSENKRRKLQNKVDSLETDKKLDEIDKRVENESLNTSIDKFYDQYKSDSRR